MKIKQVYTIQPITLEIDEITLYQDEQVKILDVKNGNVKFLRLKTNEILEVPKMALEIAIDQIKEESMKKYRLEVKTVGKQVFLVSAENEEIAIEKIKNNSERYIVIENMEVDWESVKIKEEQNKYQM